MNMAEIENILVKVFIVKFETCHERTVTFPITEWVEKERFDNVQAKVVRTRIRNRNKIGSIAVHSGVSTVHPVHWGRATVCFGTVRIPRCDAGFQFVNTSVRTISFVTKSDQMIPVGDITLIKKVGPPNFQVKRWINTLAPFDDIVTPFSRKKIDAHFDNTIATGTFTRSAVNTTLVRTVITFCRCFTMDLFLHEIRFSKAA
mmetsp:Transcript_8721/g.18242  ORF Transcript_8721/g.18242 Transcript_8721/m.18242 type:complete len:202 (-) Transcript_8721:981-1586(-)